MRRPVRSTNRFLEVLRDIIFLPVAAFTWLVSLIVGS